MLFDKPIIQNDIFEGIMGLHEYLEYQKLLTLKDREDIVLISISEPTSDGYGDTTLSVVDPISVLGYHDVLEMKFWDVEEPIRNYLPLTDEQGSLIREFIQRNTDKKFLIHCKAGISRSAGIGKAVECLIDYNGDKYAYSTGISNIGDYDRYFPNRTVYDKILG